MSDEKNTESDHEPLAVSLLVLVTVQVISVASPGMAEGGTTIEVICRSEGGGNSMTSGTSLLRSLFRSKAPSNTLPSALVRAGSVITKTKYGPTRLAGNLTWVLDV